MSRIDKNAEKNSLSALGFARSGRGADVDGASRGRAHSRLRDRGCREDQHRLLSRLHRAVDARVDAGVARLAREEDAAVRRLPQRGPRAMRAARRVRVGAVDVGVGGPVLDEEAVAVLLAGWGSSPLPNIPSSWASIR